MKIIFLIRHAKSSWENEQIKDHERPLNKKGLRDGSIMGEKLNTLDPAPKKYYVRLQYEQGKPLN